jgi:hypothetical protein
LKILDLIAPLALLEGGRRGGARRLVKFFTK